MMRALSGVVQRFRRFGKPETDPTDQVPEQPPLPPHPRVELHETRTRVQTLLWQAQLNHLNKEGNGQR